MWVPLGQTNEAREYQEGWGSSLVAQWLRIRLPMQGTRVRALVREDPTCRGASEPVCHNYWACALEPASHNYWAHEPQLLKPSCLEPMLCNKRKVQSMKEKKSIKWIASNKKKKKEWAPEPGVQKGEATCQDPLGKDFGLGSWSIAMFRGHLSHCSYDASHLSGYLGGG